MNRIVVARGDETGGWVLDYDAAAWGQLTITERTQVIFDEKLQRWMADHYQNQTTSYFDRLLKGLDDERLKKAVLAAWAMIPAQEQEILSKVFARFTMGTVENGLASTDLYIVDGEPHQVPGFRFEITIDVNKHKDADDEEMVNSILHEFVHVAYRHGVIKYWLKAFGARDEGLKALDQITEMQAVMQARTWQDAAAN